MIFVLYSSHASMIFCLFLKNFEISSTQLLSDSVCMIPTFTKNSIALTNSVSEILSVAHHPAVFFIQSGTPCVFSVDWDELTCMIPP